VRGATGQMSLRLSDNSSVSAPRVCSSRFSLSSVLPNDRLDADRLSELLRLGSLKPVATARAGC
jgi:hypothetical protein